MLTLQQQAAFQTLLPFIQCRRDMPRFAVLEGFAGTGKTWLVAHLLASLSQVAQTTDEALLAETRRLHALRIAIAAPTNKAVRVLNSKLKAAGVVVARVGNTHWNDRENREDRDDRTPPAGCTCRSIHSFLGLQLQELDNGQQQTAKTRESSLARYDLAIIDEASMLSVDLFERIVFELKYNCCRVLFVGDPAQLPPVDATNPAEQRQLSPVFTAPINLKVRLSEVVRQAQDNPIIRLSIRLRQLIEAGIKAEPLTLLEALPSESVGAKATLEGGDAHTLIQYWLTEFEYAPDADTRIIAYTNERVQFYNRAIHRALHGETQTVFVPGERVIVHEQCEARRVVDKRIALYETMRLITSEELLVQAIHVEPHPFYPAIPANRVELVDSAGGEYVVYVAVDPVLLYRQIDAYFADWRAGKAAEKTETDAVKRAQIHDQAVAASGKGWSLKKAFAPLRHTYAITCHKSQGSTFDCALVDFSDLAKMPNAFEFNRALYVAVTRSREFLALVVT